MLVLRGVNVFPSEIEAVLLASPELGPHYTIVLDSVGPWRRWSSSASGAGNAAKGRYRT